MTARSRITLLHLDTSPAPADRSVTRQLSATFCAEMRRRAPDMTIVHRDLWADPPPMIGPDWLAGDPNAVAPSDELLDELERATHCVLGVPMHNFTVPAALKMWIDHVVRPNRSFRFTKDGPEGLLRDRPVLVLTARGGLYQEGDMAPLDYQEPYLRDVFAFVGIHDQTFIHAEGVAMGAARRQAAFDKTEARLRDLADAWTAATHAA
jgi:FMN-dependent NADH-azoreductase